MKSLSTILSAVFVIGAGLLTSTATGQQAYLHWTLEAEAAKAVTILRGVIGGVNESPNLTVTIHVDEVIKGAAAKTVTFDAGRQNTFRDLDDLRISQAELLWMIPKPEGPWDWRTRGRNRSSLPPWVSTDQPPYAPTYIKMGQPPSGVIGMDLTLVKTDSDVLAIVRRFASISPERARIITMLVPNSLQCLVSDSYNIGAQSLVLPVTPELEPILLRIFLAPQSLLTEQRDSKQEVWLRALCIRALASFKCGSNIEMLKQLLTDSGVGIPVLYDATINTHYEVRLAAYRVLTYWGIKVPKPDFDQ